MFPMWFTKLVEEIVAEKEGGLTTAELLLRIAEHLGKTMTDMASGFTSDRLAAASQSLGTNVTYKKGKWQKVTRGEGTAPTGIDVTFTEVHEIVTGVYATQYPGQMLTIVAQLPTVYKPGTKLVITVIGVHPPTTTNQTPADPAK